MKNPNLTEHPSCKEPPSPARIREMLAEIRAGWSPELELERRTIAVGCQPGALTIRDARRGRVLRKRLPR